MITFRTEHVVLLFGLALGHILIVLNNYFGSYIFINRKLYPERVDTYKYIYIYIFVLYTITKFGFSKAYGKFIIITKIKTF